MIMELTRLQTDNLGIVLSPNIGSTNLKEFFTKRGRTLLHKMKHNTTLRVGDKDDFTNTMPKYLIIPTYSEKHRWASGVLDEMPPCTDKESLISILDTEADKIGSKDCIFYNKEGYSHLGSNSYLRHLTELMDRDNTYFCDKSKFEECDFWKYICELDNTWPEYTDWIHCWLEIGKTTKDESIKKTRVEFVDVIEKMVSDDNRLSLILDVLDNNQRHLEHIRTSDRWLDTDEDGVTFGKYKKIKR